MITMRHVGDLVRVAAYAHGERTSSDVQDRLATIVDRAPAGDSDRRERYFLRFVIEGGYGTRSYFFDWVLAEYLRDYQ